jgi:predicted glutamine amidotransferase
MRFIEKVQADKRTRDVVFHARIATSGGISAQKCHPFPLTDNARELNATQYKTKGALVFHNGVFSLNVENGLNDTQTFIKNSLAPIARLDADGLKNGRFDDLLKMATSGSRLLMLYPDGVKTFGAWTEDGGVMYSNTGYKPYTYAARSWYTVDDWDAWYEAESERREAYNAKRRENARNGAQTGAKYNASWWEKHGKNAAVTGGENGK